jgi:DNA polymerase-3 subunit beta
LHTYPVVEFPPVGKTTEPATSISETALSEAVRQVVRAASHDDGRPLLTGVLLSHIDGSIRMVATDSYRMAMRHLPGKNTIPGEEDLLVPARALSELQRLPTGTITDGGDTDKVGVAASSSEITFWQGNVQISTRLLEGRYPDYKQLIPDSYPNRLHLGKENFLAALRRVQLLVRDNTTPVRLSMRASGVDLSVQSQDVGDAAESVDGDYTGEDLIIAFNPSYLIDGVEAVTGDEVIVETADATRAATVRGAEDDDFRYLLMPVRVS